MLRSLCSLRGTSRQRAAPCKGVRCINMNQLFKKILISAIVGFMYFYLVKIFWSYFPNINPITNGLLSCCAAEPWIRSVIHVHDIIINILLCVPLAIFLVKLTSEQLWLLIMSALVPSFIYSYFYLFQPEYSGWNVSNFLFGWSVELLCLPLASLLIFFLVKRENT